MLQIEPIGFAELETALDALRDRVRAADLLDDVGNALAENVRACFVASASPYGVAWLPLKRRIGQPLRDTGRLMNSITHRVTGDSVEVGTNVGYAGFHQYGANAMRGHAGATQVGRGAGIPARPFLPDASRGLPPAWGEEVRSIIAAHVGGATDGNQQAGVSHVASLLAGRLRSGGGR
ncbi:phage virion morphogenesis protein [Sulfuritalea sp.]|uniref:phage virion morphogenesis protein n=1 Tax=Sulfuritalea sp. TaxID=2480090 RepID=UPI001ACAF341|nr:phage virion morphogenesis protein [Sulfuritalea sp.]MBN8474410.1 phage virion morphogenesis protein [Sulfuritalea sp.]